MVSLKANQVWTAQNYRRCRSEAMARPLPMGAKSLKDLGSGRMRMGAGVAADLQTFLKILHGLASKLPGDPVTARWMFYQGQEIL